MMLNNKILDAYEAYKKDLKNMGRKKSTNRSTVHCLYTCLKLKSYPHILKWTENEREFSIMFRRKGSNGWDSSDLDFFKELDSLSPSKKEKYFNQSDYELGCKRRCKANLQKMCKDKILEFVDRKSIDKSTKLKIYKFLEIPNEGDYKHFLATKKRRSNENVDVISKKKRCNFSNLEGNNNQEIAWPEEFGDVACFLDIEENMVINKKKRCNFSNLEGNNNQEIAWPEEFGDVAYFLDIEENMENCYANSNTSDTNELPEMEFSNINDFLRIKESLPGYYELPKNSLTENLPFLSNCFTPQINNGMKIEELANNL